MEGMWTWHGVLFSPSQAETQAQGYSGTSNAKSCKPILAKYFDHPLAQSGE